MQETEHLIIQKSSVIGFVRNWMDRIYSSLIGRPLVYALLMCLAGAYTGYYCNRIFSMFISGAFLCVSGLVVLFFDKKVQMLVTVVFGISVFSICYVFFSRYIRKYDDYQPKETYQGSCSVYSRNGTVSGYKNIILKLESGEKVAWLTDSIHKYGEELSIAGELTMITPKGNPGDTDPKGYFRRMGIFRSVKIHKLNRSRKETFSLINEGFRLGQVIRSQCIKIWNRYSDEETSMFLSAMIVGDTTNLSNEAKQKFKDCNLFHLLVVSGAHVGYFTASVAAFFSLFSQNKKKRTIVLAVSLILFGFVTGWSGSATRSIFTYLFVSLLSFRKTRVDHLSACALSGLILTLIDPFSLFSQGVLLSFGATFSIMIFENRVTSIMKKSLFFIPEELNRALSCFICAYLGMLPVLLTTGNSLSLLKLIIVILAGFPAELICSLGLLTTVFAWIVPLRSVCTLIFYPLRGLVSFLDVLSSAGSKKSIFRFSLQNQPVMVIVLLVSSLFLMVSRSGIKRRVIALVLSFSMIVNLINFVFFTDNNHAKVYFFDVGQGDSALIRYGNYNILIDGGNTGCGEKILSVMHYLDIDKIDMAFASHLDSDHIAGLIELCKDGYIDHLFTPYNGQGPEMSQLVSNCGPLPEMTETILAGSTVRFDDQAVFRIIWPIDPIDGGNEDSLVIVAEIMGTKILFTGDIGADTENEILEKIPDEIDILKIPHHGSRYSVSRQFYEEKKIGAAVISVGYNLYGHPSEEVLTVLETAKIPYFRTDEAGCVVLDIRKYDWHIDYYFS